VVAIILVLFMQLPVPTTNEAHQAGSTTLQDTKNDTVQMCARRKETRKERVVPPSVLQTRTFFVLIPKGGHIGRWPGRTHTSRQSDMMSHESRAKGGPGVAHKVPADGVIGKPKKQELCAPARTSNSLQLSECVET